MTVAAGWFAGRLTYLEVVQNVYGTRTALMCQLEIEYADDTIDTVVSDDS